jgi:hypothetical protein
MRVNVEEMTIGCGEYECTFSLESQEYCYVFVFCMLVCSVFALAWVQSLLKHCTIILSAAVTATVLEAKTSVGKMTCVRNCPFVAKVLQ